MGAEERAGTGRGRAGSAAGQASPWVPAPVRKLKSRRVASGAEQLDVVLVERGICGEQASALDQRPRHDHPIERIPVVFRQICDPQRVGRRDLEDLGVGGLEPSGNEVPRVEGQRQPPELTISQTLVVNLVQRYFITPARSQRAHLRPLHGRARRDARDASRPASGLARSAAAAASRESDGGVAPPVYLFPLTAAAQRH